MTKSDLLDHRLHIRLGDNLVGELGQDRHAPFSSRMAMQNSIENFACNSSVGR